MASGQCCDYGTTIDPNTSIRNINIDPNTRKEV